MELYIAAALALCSGPALADAAAIRLQLDLCVADAIGHQRLSNPNVNASAATEVAFYACRTEERAIYGSLIEAGMSPDQADLAVAKIKVQIKGNMRHMLRYSGAPAAQMPPPPGCGGHRRPDGAIQWDCPPAD